MTTRTVISADGTTIAYETNGSGPPLIVVDAALGFRGYSPMHLLARLLAEHFTVHTYDRRGRGDSGDAPTYAIEREIEDLDAILAAAGGSASVHALSSGALLALQAGAAGLPITSLSLFEPPIREADDEGETSAFTIEMTELVRAGRNRDAVVTFLTSIGVPEDVVDGMIGSTPALETIAPTLVYDCTISDATTAEVAARVRMPTLVVDSEGSSEDLTGWARAVMEALPHGTHRSLRGEWHMVPDEDLEPVLTEFHLG